MQLLELLFFLSQMLLRLLLDFLLPLLHLLLLGKLFLQIEFILPEIPINSCLLNLFSRLGSRNNNKEYVISTKTYSIQMEKNLSLRYLITIEEAV